VGTASIERLRKALDRWMGKREPTQALAEALAEGAEQGRVSYDQVFQKVGEETEEVLLSANEWRMLLPVASSRGAAWEDRILRSSSGEWYEFPGVIVSLVNEAQETGEWKPKEAVSSIFKEMGCGSWETMPGLVKRLFEVSRYGLVSAAQIGVVCRTCGMEGKVDLLIAGLKGAGVMSPKLSSFAQVAQSGSPLYELNPSLQ